MTEFIVPPEWLWVCLVSYVNAKCSIFWSIFEWGLANVFQWNMFEFYYQAYQTNHTRPCLIHFQSYFVIFLIANNVISQCKCSPRTNNANNFVSILKGLWSGISVEQKVFQNTTVKWMNSGQWTVDSEPPTLRMNEQLGVRRAIRLFGLKSC